MNAHVNLLKLSEQRYQGPVSQRFLLRTLGITIGCALLLWGAYRVVLSVDTRVRLRTNKETWAKVEPRYQRLLSAQADLARDRALLQELAGWKNARQEKHALLSEIQELVPPTVQFTRLTLRGDVFLAKRKAAKEPAPAVAAPARKVRGKAASTKVATNKVEEISIAARRFSLSISGLATGDRAEEAVVRLERALQESPALGTLFESVRLMSVTRTGSSEEQDVGCRFDLECVARPWTIE